MQLATRSPYIPSPAIQFKELGCQLILSTALNTAGLFHPISATNFHHVRPVRPHLDKCNSVEECDWNNTQPTCPLLSCVPEWAYPQRQTPCISRHLDALPSLLAMALMGSPSRSSGPYPTFLIWLQVFFKFPPHQGAPGTLLILPPLNLRPRQYMIISLLFFCPRGKS